MLYLEYCKNLLNDLFLTFKKSDPTSVLQSMDKKFIVFLLLIILILTTKSIGATINTQEGIISLMYHRFEENKYPSTNIKNEIFLQHLNEINKLKIEFISFEKFEKKMEEKIDKSYLLLTIDDGYESFFSNAWPILKKKKIPFILFISTREVGKNGYMDWKQIKEIEKTGLATIGNHSHSHDYMVDWTNEKIVEDLKTSIRIFEKELGHSPKIFSYPFGEYSNDFIKIVKDLNFKFAFGQHSGVIDRTKKHLTLPRFPINEKYGEIKRFKSILKTLPFPYENITPENRYLKENENPPNVKIKFFDYFINVENINCYSNEGNIWNKSKISFTSKSELSIKLNQKFKSERGRINCSLRENDGRWRWLGIQYVIAEY